MYSVAITYQLATTFHTFWHVHEVRAFVACCYAPMAFHETTFRQSLVFVLVSLDESLQETCIPIQRLQ
jgi:hypothetical protein